MKFPKATAALALLVAASYFFFSGGEPYMSDEKLSGLAFHYSSLPLGLVTHALVHAGVVHLAGNLIPLIIFGSLAEALVAPVDIVLLFFLSTMISSSIFSIYSQAYLIGASAGIAGIMGAALALKPKKAIPLLLFLPFILWLSLPGVSYAASAYAKGLAEEKTLLEKNVSELVAANRTAEAIELNKTAAVVRERALVVEKGMERERTTPSDLMVHVYGAVFGVVYAFILKRKLFRKGREEFMEIGKAIASIPKAIKSISKKS